MKIIKVATSQGTMGKNIGCEKAPNEILRAFGKISHNEEGRNPPFSLEAVEVVPNNLGETNQNIYNKAKKEGVPAVMLGGDHSITYSTYRAFAETNPEPGLIVFDAHPDCINYFKPPTYCDFLKVLLEDAICKKTNVVLVGIRDWTLNEIAYIRKNNIKYYSMKEIFEEGISETCENIMSVAMQWGSLYISVDIDVVDPGFAPGTGHPAPGGLTSRELLYFIQRLHKLKNLRVFDLVEVNPDIDSSGITVKLGAKLLKEMLM